MKYVLPLILLVVACGGPDLKALKDEVFEIHDEVMPKMGDLRQTRKQLMLQADSLVEVDSARAAVLIAASDKINEANEGMMIWMRNFDPEFEGSDDDIFKYLTEQKASITEVRKVMLDSWEDGKKVLESN